MLVWRRGNHRTLEGYGFSVGSSGYDTEDRLVNWQRSDSALSQLWNQTLIPATLASSALALSWDFENKLSTADVGNDSSVDVTYEFDALGRRVYRADGTSAVVYVQSGQQTIAD